MFFPKQSGLLRFPNLMMKAARMFSQLIGDGEGASGYQSWLEEAMDKAR